jgi:hypothetical protein
MKFCRLRWRCNNTRCHICGVEGSGWWAKRECNKSNCTVTTQVFKGGSGQEHRNERSVVDCVSLVHAVFARGHQLQMPDVRHEPRSGDPGRLCINPNTPLCIHFTTRPYDTCPPIPIHADSARIQPNHTTRRHTPPHITPVRPPPTPLLPV